MRVRRTSLVWGVISVASGIEAWIATSAWQDRFRDLIILGTAIPIGLVAILISTAIVTGGDRPGASRTVEVRRAALAFGSLVVGIILCAPVGLVLHDLPRHSEHDSPLVLIVTVSPAVVGLIACIALFVRKSVPPDGMSRKS